MADQHESENQWEQPGLGDREMEKDLIVEGGRREGLIQCSFRFLALLIDKFSTDLAYLLIYLQISRMTNYT